MVNREVELTNASTLAPYLNGSTQMGRQDSSADFTSAPTAFTEGAMLYIADLNRRYDHLLPALFRYSAGLLQIFTTVTTVVRDVIYGFIRHFFHFQGRAFMPRLSARLPPCFGAQAFAIGPGYIMGGRRITGTTVLFSFE
jgi:hypothetical protein